VTIYVALALFAMLLVPAVIVLVRRDRRERDLDRRALARSVVKLGVRNATLEARNRRSGGQAQANSLSNGSHPDEPSN
jgi:hypothetical protein